MSGNTDYRVKYTKHGPVRFLGHLDVMRYFQRVMIRAGLPVCYSEGYSPHQILSFAQPLSVGAESDGEYFDVRLYEDMPEEEVRTKLNTAMNEGFEASGVIKVPAGSGKSMTSVAAAEYILSFRDHQAPEVDWTDRLCAYLSRDTLPAVKKTKKGETEIDMKPLIYRWEITQDGAFHILASAGSKDNLKPSLVMEKFCQDVYGMEGAALNILRVDTDIEGTDEDGAFVAPMMVTPYDNPLSFGKVRIIR